MDEPDSASDKWQEAARLCATVLEDRPKFERQELTPKLEAAERATEALRVAAQGMPVSDQIKSVFSGRNHLVDFRVADDFRRWCAEEPEAARRAVVAIGADGSPSERVDAFADVLPKDVVSGRGARLSLASMFLLGVDAFAFPHYRSDPIGRAEKILGWPSVPASASDGEEYQHHFDFVEHFRKQMSDLGVSVPSALEAQSLIWTLIKYDGPAFKAWRGDTTPLPVDSLEALAQALYIDVAFLRGTVRALEAKRQLIFYGPPGTGKTFIARALAAHLTGDASRVEVVQFHPSYSYEDFIQGYRPRTAVDGTLTYDLVDGPLKRLADRAQESEDTHVLLIDEINRGNLPRIFGELLYLLEYRDQEMALMYSQGEAKFSLPANLLIIGTMNTADRSIGLIDAALRRRFHFKALFPDRAPLPGLLERWLHANATSMVHVAATVDRLNARLKERFGDHLQVGHSHFMTKDLNEARLAEIWELDVMPFLEDQLFGREQELVDFTLDSLRRKIIDADDQAHRAPDER